MTRPQGPGLLYKPLVEQRSPSLFRIKAHRDDPKVVAWGFWGGVLAMTVTAAVIAYEGLTGLWAIWDLLGALVLFTIGLLLLRFGPRSSLVEEPCAELDMQSRRLTLLSSETESAQVEMGLDDITEVVFGMTRYPVTQEEDAVLVQAFSLLVRHRTDMLVPVIEATPDKETLFPIARFLARAAGVPVTQVGIGVK